MTDPTTPTTEAGRALLTFLVDVVNGLQAWENDDGSGLARAIRAIEAEARAAADAEVARLHRQLSRSEGNLGLLADDAAKLLAENARLRAQNAALEGLADCCRETVARWRNGTVERTEADIVDSMEWHLSLLTPSEP